MKSLVRAAVLICILIITMAGSDAKDFNFTGKWSGRTGNDLPCSFDLREDGTAEISLDDYINPKIVVHYTIDRSKDPLWLNFEVTDTEKNETMYMNTIVEIVRKNKLRIAISDEPAERPAGMKPAKGVDVFVLERQK